MEVRTLNDTSLPFQMSVLREGKLLFSHDENFRTDFIEKVSRRYWEYVHFRNLFLEIDGKGNVASSYLERIAKNKVDLLAAKEEISNLVNLNKETFFSEKRNIFSLKYLLIQAVEALADTCQHLLSKLKGIPCEGYVDCLKKAEENKIIAPDLAQNLKRLADLRNILIYRYWIIDDEQLYEQTRNNLKNLEEFISQIDRFILKLR